MISTEPKINKNVMAVPQKTAGTTFFRKAGDTSFFGTSKSTTFFGLPVQAKLTVSSPNDPQEKEADTVADKVMRMPDPAVVATSPLPIKEDKIERKEEEEVYPKREQPVADLVCCKEDREEKLQTKTDLPVYKKEEDKLDLKRSTSFGDVTDHTINRKNVALHRSDSIQLSGRGPPQSSIPFQQNLSASKGSGSKLPGDTRMFMESRFNADFAGVRVHTGVAARQMSNQVHAKAFTHGNDIYFNQGKYAPDSSDGRLLLAHELTHTIQQGASPTNKTVSPAIQKAVSKKEANSVNTISYSGNQIDRRASYAKETNLIQPSPGTLRSGGFSLSSEAREYFQDSFKTDVGDIRLHVDFQAALLCRSRGVPAFVEDRLIIIDPSRYAPDSEEGGILLSKQIAESLKQRSINVPGLATQLNQGINAIITAASETTPKQAQPDQKNLLISKDKKKGPLKGKGGKEAKGKKGKQKKKSRADKSEAFTGKAVKPNPKKSPSSPEEDPAFHKVVKNASARAKDQKKHDDPLEKSAHAQKAAKAVPDEAQSAAKKRKTEGMEEVAKEDKPFDDESFKADLLKKIEEVTPKNLEQATKFKQNNKISEVKSAMGQKVASEKEKTAGPVEQATQQPLQVNEADNKKPLPLPPTPKGSGPAGIGAQGAAPKPKLANEISMEEQSQSLDTEMKSNNVSEDQLAKSNEPSFTSALKEKRGAQKDAKDKPVEFRKNEAQELKSAQASSNADASRAMSSMHATRGKEFDGTVKQQQTSKSKDEQERATVVTKIQGMYQQTETVVTTLLTVAETTANSIFDAGSEKARVDFENYVDREMTAYKIRRYSGFWGGLRWAKDKIWGMPDGVNKFYKEGRQRYLNQMDKVITQLAQVITTNLNAAKQAIKNGRKQIADYVTGLEGALKNVGTEAAESIQDKFDTLEQTVNDKREQLVDGLARKYVANLKKLDDRITELKEANKGLIAKAIGLLKEVWKVIKNLYQLFKTILSRIISVIGLIIDDPGKFFDNLGAAFKQGFDRFQNRIGEHLENGLMAWLSSQLGVADIKLPEKFDISSIFGLVLQVLGLSYENIRERAIILIGEERVVLLEKTVETGADIFQRIKKGGLGAVWDMIKEKLTDFKDMIWEAIKTFIKDTVVKAAVTFILSLLNPVAAFVKACMAIYQFIMMLVRMKDRIIDLLNSILDAVAMIASGAVDKAAGAVEMAFAKSIPLIIGFLAALLGLNDIGSKVKGIILRVREKVYKVIDWVLTKAYSIVRPVVEAAMRVKNKGKDLYEKGKEKGKALLEEGKEKVVAGGKAVLAKLKKWLGLEEPFKGEDGKQHRLYFAGSEENPVLMVQSNPTAYSTFISDLEVGSNKKKVEAKKEAIPIAVKIDEKRKEALDGVTEEEKEKSRDKKVEAVKRLLNKLAKPSAVLFGDLADVGEPEVLHTLQGAGHGITMKAKKLNKKQKLTGSPPTDTVTGSYGILNTRRQSGSASYYVKGHMLNDNIGGKGNWENLTPLSREGNSNHEGAVESLVKAAFNSGAIVEYNVTAKYGYGNNTSSIPTDDPQREDKLKIIAAEKSVPKQLQCEAWLLDKKGDSYERKQSIVSTTIDNPVGQDKNSYILEGTPDRPVVYLNKSTVNVIATIENLGAKMAVKIKKAHTDSSKERFSSYVDLSEATSKDGREIFDKNEKKIINSLNSSKYDYVKLYQSSS